MSATSYGTKGVRWTHYRRIRRLYKSTTGAAMLLFLSLAILATKVPAHPPPNGFGLEVPSDVSIQALTKEGKVAAREGITEIKGNGTWSPTASLATARYYHTATLLNNGKVLVAGGFSNSGYTATAELYDPASGTWSATGSLLGSRGEHTAVLLPNGKVLVAGGKGGSNFNPLATAELYDPTSGTWSATGSLATPRSSHTMTLLPNGKVLIAAGEYYSSILRSAEVYDPVTGTWSTTGSLSLARYDHIATLLLDGKVLVAGGYDSATNSFPAAAELYDPSNGTWSVTGRLITPRTGGPTATLLPNGLVLIAGGSGYSGDLASAELYDPATGTWSITGSLANARWLHAMTLLSTGEVLIAGGFHSAAITSAELYDPGSGTWRATGSLTQGCFLHTLTVQPDGKVLSAGGSGGNNGGPVLVPIARAELYDIGPLPSPSSLGNISTRLRVLAGDNALFGGMIATGTANKKVIIRAIGPTLSDFGVSGALQDPTLELYQGSTLITSNDDWRQSSQHSEIKNIGLAPHNDAESAIIATLTPNQNYTAIVRGKNGTTGIGVVEAFDLDQAATSKLGNISTRGFVDVDDNVMIAGLIVSPSNAASTKVLVRALGPTLGDFGVSGFLANPTLDLVNSSGTVIRSNDNWKDSQRPAIEAANLAPSHDEEAALVQTITPGAYTAIVRGSGRTTGVGLVEVYNIQ